MSQHLSSEGLEFILGPTNTGKTYAAIERMLSHKSGMMGLPLRLLAREVYDKIVARVGVHAVALITGEEKILPDKPQYYICTAEAMPRDVVVDFVCIDECQIAADAERGHVFTDRILNWRGREETWLLGAHTMQPILKRLFPKTKSTIRPRLSKLSYGGVKKLSRLPPRSAVVAFSQSDVYAIAELLRRQKGGAAVVLGALSPQTRNKQVELFQNGDVDVLVATDAIGMGLNLNINLVTFASTVKYDGFRFRELTPAELGQIAGRAGRYMNDGEFGCTANVSGFEQELVERIEGHNFDAVTALQWRNSDLDFDSIASLKDSLNQKPEMRGLIKARAVDDVQALENVTLSRDVLECTDTAFDVERLWSFCQIPDYRKLSPHAHAELVSNLYCMAQKDGFIKADWFKSRIGELNKTDGDIETLSHRIAQSRTWNYVANHGDWLEDAQHWQDVTRALEMRLSDALHERLMQRFTERGTQKLVKALGDDMTTATHLNEENEILVDGQVIGQVKGLKFTLNTAMLGNMSKPYQKAANALAESIIQKRVEQILVIEAPTFTLQQDGTIDWQDFTVARLKAGKSIYAPDVHVLCDTPHTHMRDALKAKIMHWLQAHMKKLLPSFFVEEEIINAAPAVVKGLHYRLQEHFGWVLNGVYTIQERTALKYARSAFKPLGLYQGEISFFCTGHQNTNARLLTAQLYMTFNGLELSDALRELFKHVHSGRSVLVMSEKPIIYEILGFVPLKTHALRLDVLEWLLKNHGQYFKPMLKPLEIPAETLTPMLNKLGVSLEVFTQLRQSIVQLNKKDAPPKFQNKKPSVQKPEPKIDMNSPFSVLQALTKKQKSG